MKFDISYANQRVAIKTDLSVDREKLPGAEIDFAHLSTSVDEDLAELERLMMSVLAKVANVPKRLANPRLVRGG
jgi:hypothetical protein